jgi:hypothetical protein
VDYAKDSTWIAWNQAALLRLWGQDNAAEVVQLPKGGLQPPTIKCLGGELGAPKVAPNWKPFIPPLKAPILQWKAWKTPKVPDSPSINDDMGEPYDIDTMMDDQNEVMNFETPVWEGNPMVSVLLSHKGYVSRQ